jgi:hypothetical protein
MECRVSGRLRGDGLHACDIVKEEVGWLDILDVRPTSIEKYAIDDISLV